jgi:DNA-binding transcriptional regulator YhcF (GntR family)
VKFHIDKNADAPVHHQLREQIIFLISTGELPIGSLMPGVRELERRLGIHRNTVSHVYAELEREGWLVKRPGSHFAVVQASDAAKQPDTFRDLDELIDRTIHLAQERGYTLQQLAHRVRRRLMMEPPDHLLIIEPEAGMGEIMKAELMEAIGHAPASCSLPSLLQDPSQAIGAVLLTPAYLIDRVESIPPKYRTTIVPLSYSNMNSYFEMVVRLSEPSVIGIVSVSMAGLKTSIGILAPAVGVLHSMCAFVMTQAEGRDGKVRKRFERYVLKEHPTGDPVRIPSALAGRPPVEKAGGLATPPHENQDGIFPAASACDLREVDLLFCDSITYAAAVHPRRVRYRLLSDESLRSVATAAKSLKPSRSA